MSPGSGSQGLWGAVTVVTGAGSGIGRALALALAAEERVHLVLVGRREAPLEDCAHACVAAGAPQPLVAPCDVTDAAAVADLVRRVEAGPGPARVLVNNAGRGAYGPFLEVPLAEHRAVIDTNLAGVVALTHGFLPQLRRTGCDRGGSHLVFVSSILGELPAPEHAVYGATKFAVSGFAESLRHELHGTGVHVTVAEPGLVRSGFQAVSGTPLSLFEQMPWKTAAAAAQDVLKGMRRLRRLVVGDRLAAFGIRLRRHTPRLFAWGFGVAFRRLRRTSGGD